MADKGKDDQVKSFRCSLVAVSELAAPSSSAREVRSERPLLRPRTTWRAPFSGPRSRRRPTAAPLVTARGKWRSGRGPWLRIDLAGPWCGDRGTRFARRLDPESPKAGDVLGPGRGAGSPGVSRAAALGRRFTGLQPPSQPSARPGSRPSALVEPCSARGVAKMLPGEAAFSRWIKVNRSGCRGYLAGGLGFALVRDLSFRRSKGGIVRLCPVDSSTHCRHVFMRSFRNVETPNKPRALQLSEQRAAGNTVDVAVLFRPVPVAQ